MKTKLIEEESQLSQNVEQLKLVSFDGKKYLTDVANIETLFRLIQLTFYLTLNLCYSRSRVINKHYII
jgi:hypothetical protein